MAASVNKEDNAFYGIMELFTKKYGVGFQAQFFKISNQRGKYRKKEVVP
jgi:hypothetical protein